MDHCAPETDPIAPQAELTAAAGELKDELLAEIEQIGPKLAASIPSFRAFYLVGRAALGELELVGTGSAWVCGSEMSFVLISDAPIPGPTLRCLQAGIGLRLGGMRVRLRHFNGVWLKPQASKHREGFEMLESRKLLAGTSGPVDDLDTSWGRLPSPDAAENLLVDSLELLLRAWPETPMLTRRSYDDAQRQRLVLQGAITELARNLGDALLLLDGSFECAREERAAAIREAIPEGDPRAAVLEWAYSRQPLLEEPPLALEDTWALLRDAVTKSLADAVSARAGEDVREPRALLRNVRSCRRSLMSRLRRMLKGKRRAGGREYTQLLLILCLAIDEEGNEDKKRITWAAKLLSRLGGPILANPCWSSLRRETLLLEPWEHRLLGQTPVPGRIESAKLAQ